MRRSWLAVLLLFGGGTARAEDIAQLPPWVVAETVLRPDAPPVHASALLPEEAWAGRAVSTLADAFRATPGAILQESFGGFEPPRISIRGSGIQSAPSSRGVVLRLNDLPLGLADGSFNSGLVDPLLAGQVEVQRGLDGWRAAPMVGGGALDFRRTTTAPGLRFEAGSFGATRVHGNAGARAAGATVGGAFSHSRQEGYRAHSAQGRTALLGAVQRPLAPDAKATVEFYYADLDYDVPGGLTLALAQTQPRSISAEVQRDQPNRRARLARLAATAERANAEWELTAGISFGRTTDDFQQLQANGVTRSRSRDAHLRAAAARRLSVDGVPHQFRAALMASGGWRDQQRFLNLAGKPGTEFARDDLRPMTGVIQVEDTFALTRNVVGSVGLAALGARRAIADRSNGGGSATRTVAGDAVLPAATMRWHFAAEQAVFVSVSRAAEPPTFDDLLVTSGSGASLVRRTQALGVQHATTWELGTRGRSGRLAWDAAVYHADWRNEILRLADAAGATRGAVNGGPTTHEGIESSARWLLCEQPVRASLSASATWSRFVFASDPVYGRNRLGGIAPHFGLAELLLEWHGAFIAAGSDWTAGRTRVDHAGKLAYGGQALTHVRVGWRDRRHWSWFAEMQNAFDRRTIASTAGILDVARNPAGTALFLPAPSRRLTVGLEWRH